MIKQLTTQSFKYAEAKFNSCVILMMRLADYITNKYIVYKINSENKDRKFKVGDEVSTDLNIADILVIHITLICVALLAGTMLGAVTMPIISFFTGIAVTFYIYSFSTYFVRFTCKFVSSQYSQQNNDNN